MGRLESSVGGVLALQAALKPELPNIDPVRKASGLLTKVTEFEQEWQIRSLDLERLEAVEAVELPVLETVAKALKRFYQADRCYTRALALKQDFARAQVLDNRRDPDLNGLQSTLTRFRQASDFLTRHILLTGGIEALEVKIQAEDKEAAEVLQELRSLGLCPTCSQPIAAEQHLHLEEM
jgi:hypothetical protein